jgi:hypothetical protein
MRFIGCPHLGQRGGSSMCAPTQGKKLRGVLRRAQMMTQHKPHFFLENYRRALEVYE